MLAGASSDYLYKQSGNQILVYSGSSLVATIPLQGDTDGTQLTFTNGTANAILTSGVMSLGGTTVSGVTAATVAPGTINTSIVSSGTSVTTGTGGTTSGAYTITADKNTVVRRLVCCLHGYKNQYNIGCFSYLQRRG